MSVQALRRGFLVSARALLLTTAALKLATLLKGLASPEAPTLNTLLSLPSPYLPRLTTGDMMWVGVGFELLALLALTRLRTDPARLLLVAFVGGVFAAYHLGLSVIGYQHPCGCLGGPLDWLHLSRRAYETLTQAIIVYLLAGSYGLLGWEGWRSLRPRPLGTRTELEPPTAIP